MLRVRGVDIRLACTLARSSSGKVLDSVIRVDHAGELGADRIYAGQMAVLVYMKNFLSRFPYDKVKPFINFTSLFNCNEQFPKSVRSYCISILKYLNSIFEDWCDSSTLSQLTKLLNY
ncbi:Ubiquinone biosynthesis protein COQ7 like protein [Atta colombica]|uniref:Ubiquinone biosynthesis protein COQ7 like protein n=1 Tax=Atta colombica TaxID=520822 RepID=A0A195BZ58_9HYME|nr:Ubiquinone biosynthesis protein COQ7 like protein [Atta colombica]